MSSNWRSLSFETSSSLVLPIYRNGLLCLTHIFLPLSITSYFPLNSLTGLCTVVTRHISYGFFLLFSFAPLQLLPSNLYSFFILIYYIYAHSLHHFSSILLYIFHSNQTISLYHIEVSANSPSRYHPHIHMH